MGHRVHLVYIDYSRAHSCASATETSQSKLLFETLGLCEVLCRISQCSRAERTVRQCWSSGKPLAAIVFGGGGGGGCLCWWRCLWSCFFVAGAGGAGGGAGGVFFFFFFLRLPAVVLAVIVVCF